jgi:hypothetical protein
MKVKSLVMLFVLGLVFLPFASGQTQISGIKYNDLNADGFYEAGEPALPGWTINLMQTNGVPVTTAVTDANGKYNFPGLTLTEYMVTETPTAGWIQTGPKNGHYMPNISQINEINADFGNVQWSWQNKGGVISAPRFIKDYYGDDHIFVRGSDNGLYDYYSGSWHGLGGGLASDPLPMSNDTSSYIHIFVRGTDNGLYDYILNVGPTNTLSGSWYGLGGGVLSSPSGAINPSNSALFHIVIRGTDNNIYVRSLDTTDLSGIWSGVSASYTATLDPSVIFDSQKQMHVFFIDGGTMKDVVMDTTGTSLITQLSLAGITPVSSPKVVKDSTDGKYLDVYATGSDNKLWLNRVNTLSLSGQWQSLGGGPAALDTIAAPGALGVDYKADPALATAANGNIYAFAVKSDGSLMYNILYTDGMNEWFNLATPVISDPGTRSDTKRNVVPFAAKNAAAGLSVSQYTIV